MPPDGLEGAQGSQVPLPSSSQKPPRAEQGKGAADNPGAPRHQGVLFLFSFFIVQGSKRKRKMRVAQCVLQKYLLLRALEKPFEQLFLCDNTH